MKIPTHLVFNRSVNSVNQYLELNHQKKHKKKKIEKQKKKKKMKIIYEKNI